MPTRPVETTHSPKKTKSTKQASTKRVALKRSPLMALRQALKSANVDVCLIPSADPHLSEYLPEYWQIRKWLTGFTGSVGTVVVTQDFAGVWVDSRYWVQAERELKDSGVQLMKIATAMDPSHVNWIAENVQAGGVIAVDGRALSLGARQALVQALRQVGSDATLRLDLDLPGECWLTRPALPDAPVRDFPLQYAGLSRKQKMARVRKAVKSAGAKWHLISTLDDIAWLLNLRGNDVTFNPVFMAHLLIGPKESVLFVMPGKVDRKLAAQLALDGVRVEPYDRARDWMATIPSSASILIDPARTTCDLVDAIGAKTITAINPSTLIKSQKTAQELAHIRKAMEQDGAALCEFFSWLERTLQTSGRKRVTELTIDEELLRVRQSRPGYVSRSFSTIAGFNANGAMPHYRATPDSHAVIQGDGLLLIDSGAQYLGGTTDITRVVPVGSPSKAQCEDYTAVLRAMIALSRLRFPEGILSPMIDAVARAPLWERLAEYGHGTGHGVGFHLNVHEGPQVISYRAPVHPHTAMRAGMITSNEPGLYRPGKWGVRIENLVCNKVAGKSEFGEFLEFETLTLCPIDTRCVLPERMRADEIAWLNQYHAEVCRRLSPHVSGEALRWLVDRTRPVTG